MASRLRLVRRLCTCHFELPCYRFLASDTNSQDCFCLLCLIWSCLQPRARADGKILPHPTVPPSSNPLCDSSIVECLDIDDFADHLYGHLQVLPKTDQRDTAAVFPVGIALGLFGRVAQEEFRRRMRSGEKAMHYTSNEDHSGSHSPSAFCPSFSSAPRGRQRAQIEPIRTTPHPGAFDSAYRMRMKFASTSFRARTRSGFLRIWHRCASWGAKR